MSSAKTAVSAVSAVKSSEPVAQSAPTGPGGPTITMGRIVYWRSHESKIYAAMVAWVGLDGQSVNLTVSNHDGTTFPARGAKPASDVFGSLASQTVDNTWFWPPRT